MNWVTGLFGWVLSLFGVATEDTEEAQQIQKIAIRLCGFEPTLDTVLALVAANPITATGAVIARKICAAVTARKPLMLAGGAPPVVVDGVVIEGEFITKE